VERRRQRQMCIRDSDTTAYGDGAIDGLWHFQASRRKMVRILFQ
jgi:hypothetical protein